MFGVISLIGVWLAALSALTTAIFAGAAVRIAKNQLDELKKERRRDLIADLCQYRFTLTQSWIARAGEANEAEIRMNAALARFVVEYSEDDKALELYRQAVTPFRPESFYLLVKYLMEKEGFTFDCESLFTKPHLVTMVSDREANK